MSDMPAYEIRLKGHLDARWAAWFDGLTLTRDSDGTTVIHGPVADQAASTGGTSASSRRGGDPVRYHLRG